MWLLACCIRPRPAMIIVMVELRRLPVIKVRAYAIACMLMIWPQSLPRRDFTNGLRENNPGMALRIPMSEKAQPIEKLKAFRAAFKDLVRQAEVDRVPLQNLILELEMEKFRLQANYLARMAEQEALAAARAIVPASMMLDPNASLRRSGV